MSDQDTTAKSIQERLASLGERIDAVQASVPESLDLPDSDYTRKIRTLDASHRRATNEVLRLGDSPESSKDWSAVRKRLDEELDAMDRDLTHLEREADSRSR